MTIDTTLTIFTLFILILLYIIVPWKIVSKAGYPGFYSLFLLIPIVNIILIVLFAFAKWPVEEKAERR